MTYVHEKFGAHYTEMINQMTCQRGIAWPQ